MNETYKISKLMYFDKNTATDYVQMMNTGKLDKTTELFSSMEGDVKSDISANVSIGIRKLVKNILNNILNNTLLTDFLNANNSQQGTISNLEGYQIQMMPDSFNQIVSITPITKMMKGSLS